MTYSNGNANVPIPRQLFRAALRAISLESLRLFTICNSFQARSVEANPSIDGGRLVPGT